MLGLCCCMWALSSVRERADSVVVALELLMAEAPLSESTAPECRASEAAAHGLRSCSSPALEQWPSSCGPWASLPYSMWDLLRPGIAPMSPALLGRFLSTVPPGTSQTLLRMSLFLLQVLSFLGCWASWTIDCGAWSRGWLELLCVPAGPAHPSMHTQLSGKPGLQECFPGRPGLTVISGGVITMLWMPASRGAASISGSLPHLADGPDLRVFCDTLPHSSDWWGH